MAKTRIIEPYVRTPAPAAPEPAASGRLPETLLSEQVQRLTVCAAVGAGLWTYGLGMDTFVRPLALGTPTAPVIAAIEVVAIAMSLVLFGYVRYSRHAPQTKTDIGLAYIVVNAIAVSLLNTTARTPTVETMGQLSWNTIVILVASLIMPSTPRRLLVTSLVAATMDPLSIWFVHLRGIPVPSVVDTFVLFMPNYACAVVGTIPSRVLHRLGHRLRQAQALGSYHLEELLGRGGMGEVWRGRHRLLKTSAAIKLVRPELLGASGDAEAHDMLLRFEREAQATAAFSSPHTIRVFDFGVTADHTFYYVMELLAGRDLDSLVKEFGPVPEDRTRFLLEQVCHSLGESHSRGLVHRDVTPANIYVCRMGLEYDFVKVLDFGLVTSNDRSLESTLMTGARLTTGTPAFMAPEVILDGEVDERADVYALGCVAYYLLTGQLVFEADTPMKMFVQHLQTRPIPPSQRTEMPVSRELEALVLACLEKDPAERPQNAQEVLQRLRQLRSRAPWTGDSARRWWEQHLMEMVA
jgi:serine/threonine-protein kinase